MSSVRILSTLAGLSLFKIWSGSHQIATVVMVDRSISAASTRRLMLMSIPARSVFLSSFQTRVVPSSFLNQKNAAMIVPTNRNHKVKLVNVLMICRNFHRAVVR